MNTQELITFTDPKSPTAEAYRTLRTNIQFSSLDNPISTIMVTGSGPSEGKSTTAGNLAVVLANAGARVLLVDADLRKPRVHKMFNLSNQTGMTNILVKDLDYKDHVIITSINRLEVLTAGTIPPNPSELLASKKMRGLIEQLKTDYDYVIIDTPPAAVVTDAAVLSRVADGVLLVCASGQVAIEGAQRAKALLENAKANILGVVLNKIPVNSGSYSQYMYYSYYGEEEQEVTKPKRKRAKRSKING
ncbi:CpsD/CapB family tyrosine-protein kinase [Serpentinicella sp. ANB-PHB4]|uniref:CpsD/CapB family tyrosine-protein kinase n=1 Tax=Serpentinicella sp. ANB-PHB4 TaxID=3074076 RepID=UPI00285DFBE4|nr:CpsD/CapB family tyrosine-protein kinase [Serpentinicella sp. ANB-PHB4]MDR5659935.1 CpsD/CapB family tyrosine-protein kinase [Serpentinicella sp. ANB-PHB4]